ncbi:MAG TPA: Ig-like domain-containing protein [Thermoplasmata archaeon]|nr:Ig-like domain-containing protein [Thermoplasmata archaeon]
MSGRAVGLAACALVILLLVVYVPAPAVSAPSDADSHEGQCHQALTSSIQPLPAYSPKDVWVNYTVNGSRGERGHRVLWTELWYQVSGSDAWALYAPPWNPTGHWIANSGTDHGDDESGHGTLNGTIIFDTTFTGGDGSYNFTTVAVGRHHVREPGPPDSPAKVKASTIVDSAPPVLFLANPTPDSWTNSEWLRWAAQDAGSGVASVSVSVDGGEAQAFARANGTMNMSLTTQGLHAVRVTATDRAGNAVTVPVSFHYDTVGPTLSIDAPAHNAFVNTTDVNVAWTLADAAGISNLLLSLDSQPALTLANGTTSYAVHAPEETAHLVSLLATDRAGNQAFQSILFTVDRTPPVLEIVLPAPGSYSDSHQIQAVWMASDGGSGIDHYQVSLDRGPPLTVTNAAGTVFPNVAEGPHTVTVRAYDRAGNVAQASANVTVDTTPPVVAVTAPQPGSTVYGTVRVNWTATDAGSGVSQTNVVLDGAITPVAAGDTQVALPPTLSVGPHAVTVQVWDRAGNRNESTVAFLYGGAEPPNPTPSAVQALDFWWVIAAVVGIAVVSAYVAVRRGRRRKP